MPELHDLVDNIRTREHVKLRLVSRDQKLRVRVSSG